MEHKDFLFNSSARLQWFNKKRRQIMELGTSASEMFTSNGPNTMSYSLAIIDYFDVWRLRIGGVRIRN